MLIILDRDGVINFDSPHYIKHPKEWRPIPGSLDAIAMLHQAGHRLVVATNQSGIARGLYTLETLNKIHEKMCAELAKRDAHLSGIYFCPHHPDDKCECRKPAPGMLLQIAQDFNEDLSKAIFVGDKLTDVQAARAVNANPVLVLTGKGEQTVSAQGVEDVPVYTNLQAMAKEFS